MIISLAEAFLTLQEQEEKLMKLYIERKNSSINLYKLVNTTSGSKKELEHEPHDRAIKTIFDDIEITLRNIRKLRVSIALNNVSKFNKEYNLIDFKDSYTGEKICLQEGIILIKQLRYDIATIEHLSNLKTTKKIVNPLGFRDSDTSLCYEQISEPAFDTKKMKKLYEKYNSLIKKLELEINRCNYNTEITVELIGFNKE